MLFSIRELVAMTVPLLLQQVLAVTVGFVDTMMVSQAGEAAVAGVSLVNSLDTMLVTAFTSLCAGGTVVASQLMGQRALRGATNASKQLLYAATATALMVTALSVLLRTPLLTLLFGSVEATVMDSAQDYFLFATIAQENGCGCVI